MATMIEAPRSQRLIALESANQVRISVADMKHRIRTQPRILGMRLVAELLLDPPEFVGTIRIGRLLRSIRGIGISKAHGWLYAADVRSEDRRVRELSVRQRSVLAELLRAAADS